MTNVTPITPLSSPNPPAARAPESAAGAAAASQDFDAFLQLMTAQLRNQNPLEPLDGTAFVAQLAQFSSVEQQIKTNAKLDDLLGSAHRTSADTALGYLGRTVESGLGAVALTDQSSVAFGYDLPAAVAGLAAVITDAAGNDVGRIPLDGNRTGRQVAQWTPVDEAGRALADGTYTIAIVAADTTGKVLATQPAVTWNTVREVRPTGQDIRLILDTGGELSSADVLAVRG